jgi:hypothetical protein
MRYQLGNAITLPSRLNFTPPCSTRYLEQKATTLTAALNNDPSSSFPSSGTI